ncbi:MAG TPA: hypothetical protein EYP20_01010, partial [Aigarchaeota archaeon]|nr:hypothetical protein [Aigarchaeota archaeon]
MNETKALTKLETILAALLIIALIAAGASWTIPRPAGEVMEKTITVTETVADGAAVTTVTETVVNTVTQTLTETVTVGVEKIKIAVVSDIGGRGDLSFNDMAFKGGDEAVRDFGVEMV